ncbi:unnamed protein product [Notodromas monacha]|uniref:Uncharacterized protein n=1 Tax=Notodromas monacha TaxID=399045 RepID=A0A7R9G824_9CRUS|nr:unnamed protein product [Notodromas monacha]CAG0912832.1 unnamed protein product [Notodromas monacha]
MPILPILTSFQRNAGSCACACKRPFIAGAAASSRLNRERLNFQPRSRGKTREYRGVDIGGHSSKEPKGIGPSLGARFCRPGKNECRSAHGTAAVNKKPQKSSGYLTTFEPTWDFFTPAAQVSDDPIGVHPQQGATFHLSPSSTSWHARMDLPRNGSCPLTEGPLCYPAWSVISFPPNKHQGCAIEKSSARGARTLGDNYPRILYVARDRRASSLRRTASGSGPRTLLKQ